MIDHPTKPWRSRTSVILIPILLLISTSALAAPTLSYHDEFTSTGDVRDILLVDDSVFLATGGGVAIHDRASGAFLFKLTSKDGLPCNSIRTLVRQKDGTVLAAGDFGLAVIGSMEDGNGFEVKSSVDHKQRSRFDPIVAAERYGINTFLLGFQSGPQIFGGAKPSTSKAGLFSCFAMAGDHMVLGSLDGGLEVRNIRGGASMESFNLTHPVLSVAGSKNGWLVATGNGLFLLEHGRLEPIHTRNEAGVPVGIVATSTVSAEDGEVLVGTHTGDLYIFSEGVLTHLGRFEQRRITALEKDGEALYVGYEKEGLYRVDLKESSLSGPLRPTGEICSNHVTQMTRHAGLTVAGTFDGGACYLKDGAWHEIPALRSPYVHGVASDGRHLWVANSNGIDRYDTNFNPVPIDDEDPNNLKWFSETAGISAVEQGPGKVAISSAYGVMLIKTKGDRVKAKFINHREGVPGNITKVDAAAGELFVASETEGVKAMGLGAHTSAAYLDPVHLPEAWVMDISARSPHELWVATCQNGVAYIKDGDGLTLRRKDGLPDDRIISIAADNSGAFIGTLGGLAHATIAGKVNSYTQTVGAPDPRASLVHRDGEQLWYGTESGLVVYSIE